MSRKVFISILGSSIYKECTYGITNGFTARKSCFIQEATLEYLTTTEEWTSQDQVYIVLSDKARTDNWSAKIKERADRFTNTSIPYKGLEAVLSEMKLPMSVDTIDIPNGETEDEMWSIFGAIFDKLEEGDRLYIDLTHSFRYMPMLLLVLANYSGFLKSTETVYVSYGNFEVARSRPDGIAPIMDLNPLVELQSWSFAAADFLNNGYPDALQRVAKESLSPLLKNSETRNEDTQNINKFVKKLVEMSVEHQNCRGKSLYNGKTIRSLHDTADKIEVVGVRALGPIFDKVKSSLYYPQLDSALNVIKSARWCSEKGLIQQSATLLQEAIISYIAPKYGIEVADEGKREIVTSAFCFKKNNTPEQEWGREASVNKEITRDILDNEPLLQDPELVDKFIALSNLRNDFNHAGFRSNAINPQNIKDNLKSLLDYFTDKIESEYSTEGVLGVNSKSAILLNLSNHPSERWSEEQVEAARGYGEIVDIPFPQIAPECTDDELDMLVDDYYGQVVHYSSSADVTVHVMGEMTFTYRMVSRLKDASIPCIAATTYREVEEVSNGDKVVHFDFRQFRYY